MKTDEMKKKYINCMPAPGWKAFVGWINSDENNKFEYEEVPVVGWAMFTENDEPVMELMIYDADYGAVSMTSGLLKSANSDLLALPPGRELDNKFFEQLEKKAKQAIVLDEARKRAVAKKFRLV